MASKSTIIAISAVAAVAVVIVVVVASMGFAPSSVMERNGADAQSDNTTTAQESGEISRAFTYLSTQTVLVPSKDSADAEAFCQDRDVVLSGGYTIGIYNSTSLSGLSYDNAILYSNTAVRVMNDTTIHEGWHAGLVNAGTTDLTVTANAVCLDVTPNR